MSDANKLNIWMVYKFPKDFPDKYVARLFLLAQPTSTVLVEESLERIRERLPRGLCCLPRLDGDEPHIVEVWL